MILNAKGKPIQRIQVDREEAEQAKRIFELFAEKGKSLRQIAKLLNAERIGNKTSWSEKTVKTVLERSMYVGREQWGASYKVVEEWVTTTKYRPEEERLFRNVLQLRMVDDETWVKAAKRLALMKKAYAKKMRDRDLDFSRSDFQHARLFRLRCKRCGKPLTLIRGGDRPVVRGVSGKPVGGSCENTGDRSLVEIEESLLCYLLDQLDDEAFLSEIVTAGNAYIEQFAEQPRPDVAAVAQRLAKVTRAIKKAVQLATRVDDDLDDEASVADQFAKRIIVLKAG